MEVSKGEISPYKSHPSFAPEGFSTRNSEPSSLTVGCMGQRKARISPEWKTAPTALCVHTRLNGCRFQLSPSKPALVLDPNQVWLLRETINLKVKGLILPGERKGKALPPPLPFLSEFLSSSFSYVLNFFFCGYISYLPVL